MRRELRHDRPRGSIISRNRAMVEAAERRSRAIADTEAMRWVDLGLRYLSGMVEQLSSEDHEDVPSVVLVKVGKAGLEVVLSAPPKGRLGWFSPTADGAGLVLDSDLEIEDLELLAADHWPAWPVVVSVGESDGGTVLMNLEYAGCLSVEGDSGAVRGALAAVLLQLVSQPWSQEMLRSWTALPAPARSWPGTCRFPSCEPSPARHFRMLSSPLPVPPMERGSAWLKRPFPNAAAS